jgi:hypothetical protein
MAETTLCLITKQETEVESGSTQNVVRSGAIGNRSPTVQIYYGDKYTKKKKDRDTKAISRN